MEIKSNINFQSYKNQKLVVSYNPFDYGILINKITLKDSVVFILQENNGLTISFRSFEKYNQVELFKDGTNLIKFTDFKLTENRFMRIIDNKKFYFENNQQILSTKEIKSRFISKLEKSNKLINNFITLDIETYIKDSILIPFCISIYDGKRTYSFFLSDFKDLKSTFPFLFVNKDNLNYYGQVPEFYAFGNKISKSDYKNYISKFNNN